MKGGYLEDRFNNGCFDLSEEPYTFVYWSLIDSFVYFSHHFITIPPLGWIEAGHKNGVKILGTIITEFDSGSKICKEILENRQNIDHFISKCVDIAQSGIFFKQIHKKRLKLLNLLILVCVELSNLSVIFVTDNLCFRRGVDELRVSKSG